MILKSDSSKCDSYDPIKGLCKITTTACNIVKADPNCGIVSKLLIKEIQALRNALIVAANNAHERKAMVNELLPTRMFYNEMQFQSLVNSSLLQSNQFKSEYESATALKWNREVK